MTLQDRVGARHGSTMLVRIHDVHQITVTSHACLDGSVGVPVGMARRAPAGDIGVSDLHVSIVAPAHRARHGGRSGVAFGHSTVEDLEREEMTIAARDGGCEPRPMACEATGAAMDLDDAGLMAPGCDTRPCSIWMALDLRGVRGLMACGTFDRQRPPFIVASRACPMDPIDGRVMAGATETPRTDRGRVRDRRSGVERLGHMTRRTRQ